MKMRKCRLEIVIAVFINKYYDQKWKQKKPEKNFNKPRSIARMPIVTNAI
jgi:hypothetical protein